MANHAHERSQASGRRAYSPPRLVDYGPLSALTRGDSGKKVDDLKGATTPTKK